MRFSLLALGTAFVLVPPLLFGCRSEPAIEPVVGERTLPTPHPSASVRLEVESDLPLELEHIVAVGEGSFLASTPGGPTLWRIDVEGSRLSLGRGPDIDPDARIRPLAMAHEEQGLGVLDQRGWLTVWDLELWEPLERFDVEASGAREVLGLHALPDGTWIVAEENLVPSDPGGLLRAHVQLRRVSESGTTVFWTFDKLAEGRDGLLLRDFQSFSGLGGTLRVNGAWPPRTTTISISGGAGAGVELQDPPRRPLDHEARDEMSSAIQRMPEPLRSSIQPIDAYPAVAGVWGVRDGLVVLAGAGPDTFAVDWYCSGRYAGTLFSGATTRHLSVQEAGLFVLDAEPEDLRYEMRFFRWAELPLDCT